jgi:DNA-binding MarR family transcriptional regulator/Arc/MetJ-type ribon-helix-helix transcriptional regulator
MNRPQRDIALLQEADVSLDRALFPLLLAVERKGPIGVVELGELVGRDYTTVSRQVAKLERLGLIARRSSKADKRIREAEITAQGKQMTRALDAARGRMATVLFAKWSKSDRLELVRLLRRFVDDFRNLPTPKANRLACPQVPQSGMVFEMAATKVTITLPDNQIDEIRSLVATRAVSSVSAFVKHAVELALSDAARWREMLEDGLRQTGGPLTEEERTWADKILMPPDGGGA